MVEISRVELPTCPRCGKAIRPKLGQRIKLRGDLVLDNFYGIGSTGLLRLNGYNVLGIELEDHFVEMSKENALLLDKKAPWVPHLGTCRIIQGDSRKLSELLGQGQKSPQAAVLSPPYGHDANGSRMQGSSRMDPDSPNFRPYAIRTMAEAEMPDANITSPPYFQAQDGGKGIGYGQKTEHGGLFRAYRPEFQGEAKGQIGQMPDASIASPPYEQSLSDGLRPEDRERYKEWARASKSVGLTYGQTPGQLGKESGETYQSAMLACYRELRKCLKPGGVACVVVKNPTRGGALRRLDITTANLLLMAGFEL